VRKRRALPGQVAPITGAWIETFVIFIVCPLKSVAPITGAWIETKEAALQR